MPPQYFEMHHHQILKTILMKVKVKNGLIKVLRVHMPAFSITSFFSELFNYSIETGSKLR